MADAAIIVVSGKAGIEVGTKKAWEMCEKYKLPRMVFVTDMDIDEASYRQVVEDLQQMYGKRIAPVPSSGQREWTVCRICQCAAAESQEMERRWES